MGRRESSTWYTVYEAYRDSLIVIGTSRECAAFMGCTVNCFHSMVSKVKAGKNKAYCIVVEDLDTGTYEVYGSDNTGDTRCRTEIMDDDIAWKMYLTGSVDAKIAERLCVKLGVIWAWRKKNNLTANSSRGRPRKVVS